MLNLMNHFGLSVAGIQLRGIWLPPSGLIKFAVSFLVLVILNILC